MDGLRDTSSSLVSGPPAGPDVAAEIIGNSASACASQHSDSSGRGRDRDTGNTFLSRITGAPLICGNAVQVLRNASENYPAWLSAIESARSWVHFESYVIHEDEVGSRFAKALAAKAREGVPVRLVYDWLGALTATSSHSGIA